jgi:hypothetical protein
MTGGTTCPRCKQYARLIKGGTHLGEHKTEYYAIGQRPGGRIRERCPYGGGTVADAHASIPPLRRKMIDRLHAKQERGEALSEVERAWLADRGLPEAGVA